MPLTFYKQSPEKTMKVFVLKSLLFLILFLLPAAYAMAETAYVTDNANYRLRAGIGENATPIGVVYSGDKVEVLARENGWVKVRRANKQEGWVLERYIVRNPPDKLRVKTADEESKRLREELTNLTKELEELKQERDDLNGKVAEKDDEVDAWEKKYFEMANHPTSPQSYQKQLDELQEKYDAQVKIIDNHNSALLERNIKLFATGAGVLFFGILAGLFLARKGRRSYY